ncbi:MAG TPA: arylsulfatase [Bacteroidetes bacterium]|nr:arylsulfatase [Bacteroidota bacterium]
MAGWARFSFLVPLGLLSCSAAPENEPPNIILIMADDMGFSDPGCYGSEIQTPNLDRLAENGLRFSRFYNGARCCPTRASLLTGLYAHQVGVGYMADNDWGHESYRGDLDDQCVTMAEALGSSGYATYMTGKWHVTRHLGHWSGDSARMSKENWPLRRGFDRFYGTIIGAGSYYDPVTLVRDNEPVEPEEDNFYYTDAINDQMVVFINEHIKSGNKNPFFAYVAHVAPHWPLHALPEDIERYEGVYDKGWDEIRRERLEKMKRIGLLDEDTELTPRDPGVPPWEEEKNKAWMVRAMEVYAAQIERMDKGIGRIIEALEKNHILENTLIVFLSDNGGCAEILTDGWRGMFIARETRDGRQVHVGNDPSVLPGPENTYQSYGVGWANVSNTPFRLYKHFAHEGGISTPMIMHWPGGIKAKGEWRRYPSHIIDLMPTFLDVAGVEYPERFNGKEILPPEGQSLIPVIKQDRVERDGPLFWEHEGNRAVLSGKWKLVQRHNRDWALFDMLIDRTETTDLSDEMPEKVAELKTMYEEWAEWAGVLPWPAYKYIQDNKLDEDAR